MGPGTVNSSAQPGAQASGADAALEELRSRLLRYPIEQYPVQHAVSQFHLGVALLQSDRAQEALGALALARAGFADAGLTLELAKAENMQGVALREVGDLPGAGRAFAAATADFAKLDQPLEEAAASYNLGLVLRLLGGSASAKAALARAGELFTAANLPIQGGAAARELGTLLLTEGRLDEAVTVLTDAMDKARSGGDAAGTGAAANTLGLAHLAAGARDEAVLAFRTAASTHPRSIRPAEHAMAKANLALAYETQDPERARLAAGQALAVRAAPAPVRAQAEAVLTRLPAYTGGELFAVLEDEAGDEWAVVLRDEVTRWVDCSPAARAEAAGHWVGGVLQRSGRGPEFMEGFLNALLELPPVAYERIIEAVVLASARESAEGADRFRAISRSAMARFPIPQWQRLAATFDRVAAANGTPASWS